MSRLSSNSLFFFTSELAFLGTFSDISASKFLSCPFEKDYLELLYGDLGGVLEFAQSGIVFDLEKNVSDGRELLPNGSFSIIICLSQTSDEDGQLPESEICKSVP